MTPLVTAAARGCVSRASKEAANLPRRRLVTRARRELLCSDKQSNGPLCAEVRVLAERRRADQYVCSFSCPGGVDIAGTDSRPSSLRGSRDTPSRRGGDQRGHLARPPPSGRTDG
jgi:hypothetical protein